MASCNEDGCEVLTTGICINNLGLDTCPHYKSDSDIDIDENNSIEIDKIKDVETELIPANVIDVYSGKALTLSEVNRISYSALTRLIILAGMPDCGKTTLLLSIMHIFETHSSFNGFVFAGSETLLDFEEKSHPSKIDSDNDDPNTGRTPLGPPIFLHIKVCDTNDNGKIVDLLFTDISGERFRTLKDSTLECKKFILARRADHFALFFDTQRLTSLKDRASAKSAGMGILRSLTEAGSIQPYTNLQIIFSRWDLFSKEGDKKIHDNFINLLKEDIRSSYNKIYKVDFFEISARPYRSKLPFAFGIEKIFPIWVNNCLLDNNKINQEIYNPKSSRQFLCYSNENSIDGIKK